MKYLTLATGLFAATTAAAQTPVLSVYTYDSFITEWGPGPAVETAFEAVCGCDLQFVAAGDGASLLARLRLEGKRTEADVVLGLDTGLIASAMETGIFAPHSVSADYTLPVACNDPVFVPYDWGYFAFVGNRGVEAPTNFRDLGDSALKIVIQDPRSSTPGLGLLMWVKAAYGEEAGAVWANLADNIVTVTPGWSEAYGLFLEGEADLVLSYTTSPAYHLIAEEDDSKIALPFSEGHYMQVEVAAKTATTDQGDLADQFLNFLVSDAVQSIVPTTNWMYPSVTPSTGLPSGFSTLIQPEKALLLSPTEAQAARDAALTEWQAALAR